MGTLLKLVQPCTEDWQKQIFQQLSRIEDLERLVDAQGMAIQGGVFLNTEPGLVKAKEGRNSFFARLFVLEEKWVAAVGDSSSEQAQDGDMVARLFKRMQESAGDMFLSFEFISYLYFKNHPHLIIKI